MMKEKDNIKRIHEIMGVNKKVIVEQAYIDDLLQFLISRELTEVLMNLHL